jgi:hypothetical protein
LASLGATTFDVYLNDVGFWRCVLARVLTYTLGGYQVMKKWLSYRERSLLGRALTLAELTEVMQMFRRISALSIWGWGVCGSDQEVLTYRRTVGISPLIVRRIRGLTPPLARKWHSRCGTPYFSSTDQ